MSKAFRLFERFGVELEYMIVDLESLSVRPIADLLIKRESGSTDGDVVRGGIEWSNELALHVIEVKTGRPVTSLANVAAKFQGEVDYINTVLADFGATLLPGAMHPWMNPAVESQLWPHGNGEIYAGFDRIFNCAGHGWTNLQATHLNLPFRTPSEFRRLHTAIRTFLPFLPALAASSPFIEGRRAPYLDMRLETYRHNSRRIPSVTGRVIPELISTPAEYKRRILKRIYRDLKPFDPAGILQHEWSNARGAIARFERNTIEIRVLDVQESPAADLALLQFVVAVLRRLVAEELSSEATQRRPSTISLERQLLACVKDAGAAPVDDVAILRALGITSRPPISARDVLVELVAATSTGASWLPFLEVILREGTLAERLVKAARGKQPSRIALRQLYGRLASCLARGQQFLP